MPDFSHFKAPYLDPPTIRGDADEFRRQFSKGLIPVDIEDIIEFDLNIDIVPKDRLYSACQANAFLSANCHAIRVDDEHFKNEHNRPMMRFSLAHEIGHYILHKEILPIIRPNSIEDWKDTMRTFPEEEYVWVEFHAYEFAGRLLVPRERLIEELNNQKEKICHIYKKMPNIDDDMVVEQVAVQISRVFDVSDNVVAKRIKIEKIWNKDNYL